MSDGFCLDRTALEQSLVGSPLQCRGCSDEIQLSGPQDAVLTVYNVVHKCAWERLSCSLSLHMAKASIRIAVTEMCSGFLVAEPPVQLAQEVRQVPRDLGLGHRTLATRDSNNFHERVVRTSIYLFKIRPLQRVGHYASSKCAPRCTDGKYCPFDLVVPMRWIFIDWNLHS